MSKLYVCEICQCERITKGDDTICRACDSKLAADQEHQAIAKAAKWAVSHKCRKCGAGLTLDRYFQCHGCDNQWTRETEDLSDGCDDMGWDEEELAAHNRKVVARKVRTAVAKNCNTCGEFKQPSEFNRHPGMADGLLKRCKSCKNKMDGERRARVKEKMLAAKAAAGEAA